MLNKTLTLSTKGPKARVTLNPAPRKPTPQFSHESLDKLQIHINNISNKHMKAIAQFIRANIGRKCVEPGYANHITEKGQTLADIYHLSHHEFEDNDKKVTLPVVWANAEEVISTISDAREFIGKVFVKVMADGGQNFLKICLSILPEDYDSDNADTEDDLST